MLPIQTDYGVSVRKSTMQSEGDVQTQEAQLSSNVLCYMEKKNDGDCFRLAILNIILIIKSLLSGDFGFGTI